MKSTVHNMDWQSRWQAGWVAGGILCIFLLSGCTRDKIEVAPMSQSDAALHAMGKDIADAVLRKDIERLLRYDRHDLVDPARNLVESDRKLLSDPKSDLYCYLFDTSCIPVSNGGPSVYDVLRSAKQLTIELIDFGKSDSGVEMRLLLFFDGADATIDHARLRSLALNDNYLCEKWGSKKATWLFERANDQWRAVHPPFDLETDYLCGGGGG